MSAAPKLLTENKMTHVRQSVRRGRPRKRVVLTCSKCDAKHTRQGQRYCVDCHNAYMREWRKTHPLTPAQRKKDNCRSYANVYKKRGKLVKIPCEKCGSPRSQMHHPDYDKPLLVEWLCRPCHMAHHRQEKFKAERKALEAIARRHHKSAA